MIYVAAAIIAIIIAILVFRRKEEHVSPSAPETESLEDKEIAEYSKNLETWDVKPKYIQIIRAAASYDDGYEYEVTEFPKTSPHETELLKNFNTFDVAVSEAMYNGYIPLGIVNYGVFLMKWTE